MLKILQEMRGESNALKGNHAGGKKNREKKKNGKVRWIFTAGTIWYVTTAAVFVTSLRKGTKEMPHSVTIWVD